MTPLTQIPEEYRSWIKAMTFDLGIGPLPYTDNGPVLTIPLPGVYIPIETRTPSAGIKNPDPGHKPGENNSLSPPGQDFTGYPTMDIETLAANQHCLMLCGEVGMGKTTLVKHLALTVIMGTCPPGLKGYLPFIVYLNALWPILLKAKSDINGKSPGIIMEHLVNRYLRETRCPLTIEILYDFLSRGKVLFLFDGLDEIPGHIRPGLIDILAVFQMENSRNRFLFTGRPQGITGGAMKWFGDYLQTIEYLDIPMIENFIFKWSDAVSHQSPIFKNISRQDLLSRIMKNVPALVLTQVPSLLTAACILYRNVKCVSGQAPDIDDYIIEKLTGKGLLSHAESIKSNALFDYLLFIYAQTHNKNRETYANYSLHDVLQVFFFT